MSNLTSPWVDLYAPVREDLAASERVFDVELASEFSFVNRLCDHVRSYRGKRLRPTLLLLSGRAAGDLSDLHHTLAAVVEMVHVATLAHDDVLDQAGDRRGQPTVGSITGNVGAILLGDYLISHAFHLCSGLGSQYASRRIGAATNAVCEGELLQNRLCRTDRLTESDYIDIVRRKTGSLTAVCCELGAYYADAESDVVLGLHDYGMSAGVAFQIIDDVLDVIGNAEEMGKTLGLDMALGKMTLPTLHCLENAGPATASALRAAVAGEDVCDRARVREWLEETGSIEYACSVAGEYVADALRQLEPVPLSDARLSLAAMAEFILERQY